MVTVLHGEDTVASRKALMELRFSYPSGAVLDFIGGSEADFVSIADGWSLFSERKLVVVETLKSPFPSALPYLAYLEKKPETTEVVFWVGEELSSGCVLREAASRNGWRIRNYNKFNRSRVFDFVDAVFERNRPKSLNLLFSLISGGENFFGIISLITNRLRLVLWSKYKVPALGMVKPFMRSKVERQAGLFSEEELNIILTECRRIEFEMKTGILDPSFGMIQLINRL